MAIIGLLAGMAIILETVEAAVGWRIKWFAPAKQSTGRPVLAFGCGE
jgi:hypothetical protein